MRRTRGNQKRYIESSDSEDESPKKKLTVSPSLKVQPPKLSEDSSSESDIENYLQPVDKLDLSSDFFKISNAEAEFKKIEHNIYSGITRLSDSDEDEEKKVIEPHITKKNEQKVPDIVEPSTSYAPQKSTFHDLHEYTKKIEEAKKSVEEYKARKLNEEQQEDVLNLLQTVELKTGLEHTLTAADLHSSDFDSCDSEEDWEEIKNKDLKEKQKSVIPKDGLQITVDMPDNIKKKKGVDLLAAMKRRLNRIRKENQVLVHKVHVLCWIAHGNILNSAINDTCILSMALSLLPSEKCYPPDRTDLSYLEQIVNWFKKTVKNVEKPCPKNTNLLSLLEQQISKKEAYNKKMLVCLFIAVLRSLGIQCRLVLSFQVEPLRPPASELHSLSTQEESTLGKKKGNSTIAKSKVNNPVSKLPPKKSLGVKDSVCEKSSVKKDAHTAGNSKDKQKADLPKMSKLKNENLDTKKRLARNKKNADSIGTNKIQKGKVKNVELKDDAKKTISLRNISKSQNENKTVNENTKERSSKPNSISKEESNTLQLPKQSKRGRSLGSDTSEKGKDVTDIEKKSNQRRRTRSTGDTKERNVKTATKCSNAKEKKEIIKIKLPQTKKNKVQQVDGAIDSSTDEELEYVPQFDGADDKKVQTKNTRKPNLSKLKNPEKDQCTVKEHPRRLKVKEKKDDAENEFKTSSHTPFKDKNVNTPSQRNPSKANLQKLLPHKSPQKPYPLLTKSTPKNQLDVRDDIIGLIKGRIKEQKHIDRSRMVKKRKVKQDSDSDSDYAPEPIKKKHHDSEDEFIPETKVKRRVQVKKGKNVLSDSEGEGGNKKKKKGVDIWAEVFLENEEKWISVDVIFGEVHCVEKLYNRATHPMSYVVAWNNIGSIKDVTKRYCQNFNTVTRKLRAEAKWWDESIKPFLGKPTARDKEEDEDLARLQLDQPLPKSITEYKNHPLYALKRHLLKFEAIYPPNAPTLGFVRGEAVYPRGCVYTCMSRDIWLKQAKVVKLGEKPYKIVKARPKYDKMSNQMITDQMLEIFGPWQTEDYVPPTAENGVVPRNAFGNVELFKSCMLPKGTVHLKLPGLNKVAKRMNIDCASAIVGFDFHGGWSHPTYDGFVVCKEYEDVLVAAWDLEQDEIEKREQEKIDKRVYGNWKKLIRGLIIREKLKAKYDFGQSSSQGGKEKKKIKGPRFCTKKRRIVSSSSESD